MLQKSNQESLPAIEQVTLPETSDGFLDFIEELNTLEGLEPRDRNHPTNVVSIRNLERLDDLRRLYVDLVDNIDEYKILLLETANKINGYIYGNLHKEDPCKWEIGLFIKLKSLIKISKLLDEPEIAWEAISELFEKNSTYLKNAKSAEFNYMILNNTIKLIQDFYLRFPDHPESRNTAAKLDVLFAEYLQREKESEGYDKNESNIIDTSIRHIYENALTHALQAIEISSSSKIGGAFTFINYEVWDEVATKYANWLIQTGDHDEAKMIFNEILIRNPKGMQKLKNKLQAKEESKESIPVIIDETKAFSNFILGKLAADDGDLDTAEKHLKEIHKADPQDMFGYANSLQKSIESVVFVSKEEAN